MWFLLPVCIPCDPFQSSEWSTARRSGRRIVSALNARFQAGTPSDDPTSAGVVLHALNTQLGSGPSPWLSADRVSCVVANAWLPFLYHGAAADRFASYQTSGFVLRSSVVKRALLCAYGGDGGTNGKNCPSNWRATASHSKCTPGCPSETYPGRHGTVVGLNLSQAMFLHEASGEHAIRRECVAGSLPRACKAGHAAALQPVQ